MNLFLHSYPWWILLAEVVLSLLAILGMTGLASWLASKLKVKSVPAVSTVISIGVGTGFVMMIAIMQIPNHFRDGHFRMVRVYDTTLVVSSTRPDIPGTPKLGPYSHRLRTFDLLTGRKTGQVQLTGDEFCNTYTIYGPFDGKAWGHSQDRGIHLIDMLNPRILAQDEDIVTRNPSLGDEIRLLPGRYDCEYNYRNGGLRVINQRGQYYEVGMDLRATRIQDLVCAEQPDTGPTMQDWVYCGPKDSAKVVHTKGTEHSPDCVRLNQPRIIRRWFRAPLVDRVWVAHGMAAQDTTRRWLSYITKDGEELQRIDLRETCGDDRVWAYGTVALENETLILVTIGRFTLSALRTDPATGRFRGVIRYFR